MKKLIAIVLAGAFAGALAGSVMAAPRSAGTIVVDGPSGWNGALTFEVYGINADAVDLVCTNGTDLLLALNRVVTDPELGAGEATPTLWTYNDGPGTCTATVMLKHKWNWKSTRLEATFTL